MASFPVLNFDDESSDSSSLIGTYTKKEKDIPTPQDISDDINNKKGNHCFEGLENAMDILKEELLIDIIKTIFSYLSYIDSTMNGGKYWIGYVLGPIIDRNIPCLLISTPKQENKYFKYCLSSIKLELGWFPERIDKKSTSWPKDGYFYCCVQQFDPKLPPHDIHNKILWKSKLFKTELQHEWEYKEMKDIDLILEYDKTYLFYVIELDQLINDKQEYEKAYMENIGYLMETRTLSKTNWDKSIGLPTKQVDGFDELKCIKMITDVNYRISDKEYSLTYDKARMSKIYEVVVCPKCL